MVLVFFRWEEDGTQQTTEAPDSGKGRRSNPERFLFLTPPQGLVPTQERAGWVRASINTDVDVIPDVGEKMDSGGTQPEVREERQRASSETWKTAGRGGLSKWKEKRGIPPFATDFKQL